MQGVVLRDRGPPPTADPFRCVRAQTKRVWTIVAGSQGRLTARPGRLHGRRHLMFMAAFDVAAHIVPTVPRRRLKVREAECGSGRQSPHWPLI